VSNRIKTVALFNHLIGAVAEGGSASRCAQASHPGLELQIHTFPMACSLVLRGIKIVAWEDSDQSSGLLT
jgi:hypothetical protein